MKTALYRLVISLFVAGTGSLLMAGCDAFSSDENDEKGIVTLTGQVLNSETNNPVESAFIRVLPFDLLFEADSEGRYDLAVEIDSTMDLKVMASKDGFSDASVTILALAGRVIVVPTLRLVQQVGEEPESGNASNILLLKQSAASIGVRESGSKEVATIEFQLADSVGRPVILDKSAFVRFSFGVQPGGGEFLAPTEASTDNNGVVIVNLSSGTKAGIVQIIAETTVDGRTIRSLPVAVTIHGGLPDQEHFTIGPTRYNFPGLLSFGLINPINIIVGDKYSNPVRIGTSVYFSSTHGVIEGSSVTDESGGGTVDLISANPLPSDGIALITARTADDAQAEVSGSTPVVFSGVPYITLSPAIALLNQTYTLTVVDQNGNPLAEGTSIIVIVEGRAVKGVGSIDILLGDTAFLGGVLYEHVLRGPGITEFTFRAIEDIPPLSTVVPAIEAITIKVAGPNGNLEIVLGPGGVPARSSDGVDLEVQPDGSLTARTSFNQL